MLLTGWYKLAEKDMWSSPPIGSRGIRHVLRRRCFWKIQLFPVL